jgi:hypothetical protein
MYGGPSNEATFLCNCTQGYFGAACESECPGTSENTVCNGNGECQIKGYSATCICNEGFYGDECNVACPGIPACSNNGVCTYTTSSNSAECNCNDGFYGLSCEHSKHLF